MTNNNTHCTTSFTAIFCLIALLSAGCSGTRYLDENQSLYVGSTIKIESSYPITEKDISKNELNDLIYPDPNETILSSRPWLWFYNIAGEPKKKKGFRPWLKNKLGSPPILLSDVDSDRISRLLRSRLNNKGFFQANVDYTVKTKKKKSNITYRINVSRPYTIRSISYVRPETTLEKNISDQHLKSLLSPGQNYDLAKMQAERSRITGALKDLGFYYFDDRHMIFQADTTIGNRKVDLFLDHTRDIPSQAKTRYHIGEVNIFPDYSLSRDSVVNTYKPLTVDGYQFFARHQAIKPKVIIDKINVKSGALYSNEANQLSISRLIGLGVFKFVNITYQEDSTADNVLDVAVYLTPLLKKSLRLQLEAVSKSNDFIGPSVVSTFLNRNTFGGAELFQLTFDFGFETQVSSQQSKAVNAIEFGAEASLEVPRFMTPIVTIDYSSKKYIPKTRFKIGYRQQNRTDFFNLMAFNANYGYVWTETAKKSHELNPVDISLVTVNREPAFEQLLESNPLLRQSYDEQFILGSNYSFVYSTLNVENREYIKNNIYFKGSIDISGNLLNLLQRGERNGLNGEVKEILGKPYSQYAKVSADFRYYYKIDRRNLMATRFFAGLGVPYGNSQSLPYLKQFAAGGTNTIRAFRSRSLGPGSFPRKQPVDRDSLLLDQTGDISLLANIEYRFDILGALKGALFLDAGNIWLVNQDVDRPGGKFRMKDFLSEVAMGTGFGVRYDAEFFVIRFDLAFPLRSPFLPKGERWVLKDIKPLDSSWRGDNLILNIAIGYPF